MCELFFSIVKAGKGKSTQRQTCHLIFVSPQKSTSLDEGLFMVECWLWEEQWLHLLEGVHAVLSLDVQSKAVSSLEVPSYARPLLVVPS